MHLHFEVNVATLFTGQVAPVGIFFHQVCHKVLVPLFRELRLGKVGADGGKVHPDPDKFGLPLFGGRLVILCRLVFYAPQFHPLLVKGGLQSGSILGVLDESLLLLLAHLALDI